MRSQNLDNKKKQANSMGKMVSDTLGQSKLAAETSVKCDLHFITLQTPSMPRSLWERSWKIEV